MEGEHWLQTDLISRKGRKRHALTVQAQGRSFGFVPYPFVDGIDPDDRRKGTSRDYRSHQTFFLKEHQQET